MGRRRNSTSAHSAARKTLLHRRSAVLLHPAAADPVRSSNGSKRPPGLDSYLTKIETISEWFADEPLEAEERRTVNKCISDVAIFYAALLPELPAEERRTYRKQLRRRIAPNWRTLYRTGSPVQNLVGLGIRFAQPLAGTAPAVPSAQSPQNADKPQCPPGLSPN